MKFASVALALFALPAVLANAIDVTPRDVDLEARALQERTFGKWFHPRGCNIIQTLRCKRQGRKCDPNNCNRCVDGEDETPEYNPKCKDTDILDCWKEWRGCDWDCKCKPWPNEKCPNEAEKKRTCEAKNKWGKKEWQWNSEKCECEPCNPAPQCPNEWEQKRRCEAKNWGWKKEWEWNSEKCECQPCKPTPSGKYHRRSADVCPASQNKCDGSCVDFTTERAACGGCPSEGSGENCYDVPLSVGQEVDCVNSKCVVSCSLGYHSVNGKCVREPSQQATFGRRV